MAVRSCPKCAGQIVFNRRVRGSLKRAREHHASSCRGNPPELDEFYDAPFPSALDDVARDGDDDDALQARRRSTFGGAPR